MERLYRLVPNIKTFPSYPERYDSIVESLKDNPKVDLEVVELSGESYTSKYKSPAKSGR